MSIFFCIPKSFDKPSNLHNLVIKKVFYSQLVHGLKACKLLSTQLSLLLPTFNIPVIPVFKIVFVHVQCGKIQFVHVYIIWKTKVERSVHLIKTINLSVNFWLVFKTKANIFYLNNKDWCLLKICLFSNFIYDFWVLASC